MPKPTLLNSVIVMIDMRISLRLNDNECDRKKIPSQVCRSPDLQPDGRHPSNRFEQDLKQVLCAY